MFVTCVIGTAMLLAYILHSVLHVQCTGFEAAARTSALIRTGASPDLIGSALTDCKVPLPFGTALLYTSIPAFVLLVGVLWLWFSGRSATT